MILLKEILIFDPECVSGAECVEHEEAEIFHWKAREEEEAVASGDVDDFVAVAAAAARRSDAL